MDLFKWPLGGLGAALDPHDSGQAASTAQLQEEVRRLERRTDRLSLVCQALWELLRERTNLGDNDLIARMQQIDLRDGVADGRMTPMTVICPSCNRTSNSRRDECVYCGARLPGRNIVERV